MPGHIASSYTIFCSCIFQSRTRTALTNHFTCRMLTRCPMSHVLPTWAASECCQYALFSMCTRRCLLLAPGKPVFLLWKALLFVRFFVKFSACLGLACAERIYDRICSTAPEMFPNFVEKNAPELAANVIKNCRLNSKNSF